MTAHLEVWQPGGIELLPLNDARVTVGRGSGNDIPMPGDKTVSTLHAVIEPIGDGWCVQDLGSRNGTFVAGKRLVGVRALRPGDEITIGRTRIVFRTADPAAVTRTHAAAAVPDLTRREKDVLRELCRPLFSGELYSESASLRQIADALVVTDAAVQQHLLRLYDKF